MSPRELFDPARGDRVPVLVWARDAPRDALRQLAQLAAQPYVVDRVAAMPDVHLAEGVAVGTVFATEHTVVPAALGGDLGCGVSALALGGDAPPAGSLDRRLLAGLLDALGRAIPAGDSAHAPGASPPLPAGIAEAELSTRALARTRDVIGPRHLGTLGGGNHFLELDRDPEGGLWLLAHSGSRGIGAAVAAHHRRVAEAHGRGSPPGLDVRAAEGAAYLADAVVAQAFARANRAALLARAAEVVTEQLGFALPEGALADALDVPHNFVARETHASGRGGEHAAASRLVHRKGATPAAAGALGIVPGSMGTATYLVRGLGEPRAFGSCSHGAGRVMSRREARTRVDPRALDHAMRRVVYDARRARALVEEAPQVYRDIGEVLADQADLVTPVLRLEPLMVLKG